MDWRQNGLLCLVSAVTFWKPMKYVQHAHDIALLNTKDGNDFVNSAKNDYEKST